MLEIILGLSFAQWVGLLAMAVSIIVARETDDKKLIALSFVVISLWACHFYLMGVMAAVTVNVIAAIRCLVTLKWTGWKIGVGFSIALAVAGFFVYTTPISLFPIVASIVATLGTTIFTGIKMRASLMMCSSMWLTHNIIRGSIGGTIIEVINLCMFGYAIWKLYKKDKTVYL